jgi:hypothetical protein
MAVAHGALRHSIESKFAIPTLSHNLVSTIASCSPAYSVPLCRTEPLYSTLVSKAESV